MKYPSNPHIVVVGGGFGGIETIKTLLRYKIPARITLVSDKDYFEYYPALYRLVTSAHTDEVSVPLSVVFPQGITYKKALVTGIEPTAKLVQCSSGESISYDYLVLGLGSAAHYFGIAGLKEGSYSFKCVPDALKLKRHLAENITRSRGLPEADARAFLAITIVGAGPSGVELAGDMVKYMKRRAQHEGVDPLLVSVHLVEAAARVLPSLSEHLSIRATARLKKLGVVVHTNMALQSYTPEKIIFTDGELVTRTVIWTAGTKINHLYETISGVVLSEKKRVVVDQYLALPADQSIFIIGDGAATLFSGLAQTAIHHGAYVGTQLSRRVQGKKAAPYVAKKVSFVIPIGSHWALASIGKYTITGSIPWLLRGLIDLRYFFSILSFRYIVATWYKIKL